jgi:hypothetical protein
LPVCGIDAASTTPFATVSGARSYAPTESAVCYQLLPVSGSSTAQEPLVTNGPDVPPFWVSG